MWTTSQFPHIVKLLMGNFVLNIPQHKLRVVSPDVGGGFGVKQFHYAEEAVVDLGVREDRAAGEMGLRAQRRLHLRCTRPRSRNRSRARARRDRQIPRAARHHHREHGRVSVDVRAEHSDQSLRPAAGRRVYDAGHLLRSQGGVHQHVAGGCVPRRGPARGDIRARASGRRRRDRDGHRQSDHSPHQHDSERARIHIRRRS